MICYGKPLETPLIQLDKFGDWLVMGSFMSEIVESRYSPLKLTYPLPANRYFWDHDFLAWKRLVGYVPRSLEGNQVPKNSGHYMTPTQTMHYYIWEIPKKSPYIFIKFDRSQTGSHLMTENLNLQKKMPRKKTFFVRLKSGHYYHVVLLVSWPTMLLHKSPDLEAGDACRHESVVQLGSTVTTVFCWKNHQIWTNLYLVRLLGAKMMVF